MNRKNRKGAAVVEFAMVLPVFGILMLGLLEVGRGVNVQSIMTNAAREGARASVVTGTTAGQVDTAVRAYLTGAGLPANAVASATVATTPIGSDGMQVTITIPQASVAWVRQDYFTTPYTASASMRREAVD